MVARADDGILLRAPDFAIFILSGKAQGAGRATAQCQCPNDLLCTLPLKHLQPISKIAGVDIPLYSTGRYREASLSWSLQWSCLREFERSESPCISTVDATLSWLGS